MHLLSLDIVAPTIIPKFLGYPSHVVSHLLVEASSHQTPLLCNSKA